MKIQIVTKLRKTPIELCWYKYFSPEICNFFHSEKRIKINSDTELFDFH